MNKLWEIRLYKVRLGYKVVIINEYGHRKEAPGPTPQAAYSMACAQLVIKPWLENAP